MKYSLDRKADAQRLEYELKNNPIAIKNVEQKRDNKTTKKIVFITVLTKLYE